MLKRLIPAAILSIAAVSCTSETDVINDNVNFAKKQLAPLIAASEEGGVVRTPSTTKNGEVVYVPADDWVSGFFAGTLWYMYELTGDEDYAVHAQKHTEILHDIQFFKSHHDVGFMIYDSYGNGLRLKNIPGYDTVLVNTAKSLATRFRPSAGVIQSWNADGGWQKERGWKCPVIIDNMMNLELLFRASEISGNPAFREIAKSHADKTMENHFRSDYSCYHVVDYDPETGAVRGKYTAQGADDESRWARGQSWALYGYTMTYRFTKDQRYLAQAENIAHFLLTEPNMPEDLVPLWDYDAAKYGAEKPQYAPYVNQRDASSGAIMASALYELWQYTKNDEYLAAADKIVKSLSAAPYRAELGTNGGFLLQHSVGSIPHGSSIDVPLNYADYYLLEALVRRRQIANN